jgi:hypothetical protein
LISIRKDEISGYIISSIFSGRSTIEYFTAITTVALVKAAGLVVLTCHEFRAQVKHKPLEPQKLRTNLNETQNAI